MRFVDTNILIYSLDLEPAQPGKTAIAQDILRQTDIALSVQVLQEFYVQATHPRRPESLPHDLAERLIQKWLRFRIQENTVAVLQSALRLKQRFQTFYWDAAILAAAKAARCHQLLSEDLNHGQDYDGVVVVNPFLSS
ncbi:PIN domain-containing protein [Phragmitibacter flavus]|uniref:PIN domain-containing protein n=1 Tax=Phragmitibacter flavus TaxID=2576071 RepID=A0A5R8KJT0_9BACT|nr:PIN domain-containing protein [Phragmitibacter flavus]TLD72576.1 PIN domain-containing protein [Phragmitibacter flavus]